MALTQSITITFLGTGTSSGVPMIGCKCSVCMSADKKDKRLRSSILVQSQTTTVVVDTTPDFRYQMLRACVDQLDAVIFTHPHKDHIAGLDDVRAYNFFQQKSMPLFANKLTADALRREFAYAFSDTRYPGVPVLDLHSIDLDPFIVGDISIIPIKVWHLHMPVLGFRFGDLTYITDANRIDDSEKDKIRGSRVLIINALRNEQHISHFSLNEAIALVKELEIPEAYVTHISHQLGKHEDVSRGLPPGIHLGYDGLRISV